MLDQYKALLDLIEKRASVLNNRFNQFFDEAHNPKLLFDKFAHTYNQDSEMNDYIKASKRIKN